MTDTSTAPSIQTRTLEVPGAVLSYDVRGDLGAATAQAPALMLIGTPMSAAGFVTLADHFADRPVITYDPRNVDRSRCTTDVTPTPEDHASDVHAILQTLRSELGHDRVDLFGSSGGAINALALAAAHPGDLRTVVAHEPPSAAVLPDAALLVAACRDVYDTYQRAGFGVAMARFILLISAQGPLQNDPAGAPDPDPAMFGLPATDDGGRDDPMMNNMLTIPVWGPDFDALAAADCRLVLAYGEESGETMAARSPKIIAERLGLEPTVFPGDHGGFLGGEFGQQGKPDAFAATLRTVLS